MGIWLIGGAILAGVLTIAGVLALVIWAARVLVASAGEDKD